MCLLLVRYVRKNGGDLSRYELSGGGGSAAASLADALAKGGLDWLHGMFGTVDDDRAFARTIFVSKNPGQRDDTQPIRVWVNSTVLSHSDVHIILNGREVFGEELSDLEDALATVFDKDRQSEENAARAPLAVPAENRAEAAHRSIWTSKLSVHEKLRQYRRVLHSGAPRPYLLLLYSVRIEINADGEADFDFEVVLGNCGEESLTKKFHEFWFDGPEHEPLVVHTTPENRLEIVQQQGLYRFAVVFDKPVPPADVRHYRFSFHRRKQFDTGRFWELSMGTVINHFFLHITDHKPGRLAQMNVETVSELQRPAPRVQPIVAEWGRGVTIQWRLEFPEPGAAHRIRWQIEEEEAGSGS